MLSLVSDHHKLSRLVNWCVSAAAAVVIYEMARDESLGWLAWVVAGALVALLAGIRWPYGALVVLVVSSAMPRFAVKLSGWNARPEHLAAFVVLVLAFVWCFVRHRKLRLQGTDYWVLAYLLLNYVSSAVGSSSPTQTLRWALLNNLAVLPYFLVRLLVRDDCTLRRAFHILLAAGVAESAYGILCYTSHALFGTVVGVEIGQYFNSLAAPYGSLAEANLFGAYAACTAVFALALYLLHESRWGYLACFFVAALASLLSFSRAALIAFLVAAGWVYWMARRGAGAKQGGHNAITGPALAVVLVLVVVIPSVGAVLHERFGDLLNQGLMEETTTVRLIEAGEALQEFSGHRLIGTGTASLQLSFDWSKYDPSWGQYRSWVGNVIIRILHDTGVLGMAAFLGLVFSLTWQIRHAFRGGPNQPAVLVALTAGALLYAITFQATDATLEVFPWIHLGLLRSAVILAKRPTARA